MHDPCSEENSSNENNEANEFDTKMDLDGTDQARSSAGNQVPQSEKWNAMRVTTKNPQESAAICCIVMPYIDERIDYNYYVAGFDSFFIYDNSEEFVLEQWADESREKEGPNISVTKKEYAAYCLPDLREHLL
jgi:hypothetical protein